MSWRSLTPKTGTRCWRRSMTARRRPGCASSRRLTCCAGYCCRTTPAPSPGTGGSTPFDLKNGLGHLRSFLEQLHVQACAAAQKKFGGPLPSRWGEALKYLSDNAVLTKQEESFAAHFYTLMSDTGVHSLIKKSAKE